MPDYPIDLGKPMGDMPMAEPSKPSKKEKYYPTLYLEWDSDYELPDSGILEVRFKKRSQTDRTNSDGETHQTVELDIQEILDVESEADEEEENAGDVLDKYRSAQK